MILVCGGTGLIVLTPAMRMAGKLRYNDYTRDGVRRSLRFVVKHCRALAKQLSAVKRSEAEVDITDPPEEIMLMINTLIDYTVAVLERLEKLEAAWNRQQHLPGDVVYGGGQQTDGKA
jgi:hypothetical protein